MRSVTRHEWAFLAIILLFSFVPTFGGLLRIFELVGGPAIAPENPRALADPLPIVLHILSSFVFWVNSDARCNIVGGFDIRLLSHKKTMLPCQDILT